MLEGRTGRRHELLRGQVTRGDRYCVYVAYVNLLDVLVELGDTSALAAELDLLTLHENPRLPAPLRLGGARVAANGYRLLANLPQARRILDDISESIDFAAIQKFESAGYFISRSRLEAQAGHLEAAEAALGSAETMIKEGGVREVHVCRSFDAARAAVERLAASQLN